MRNDADANVVQRSQMLMEKLSAGLLFGGYSWLVVQRMYWARCIKRYHTILRHHHIQDSRRPTWESVTLRKWRGICKDYEPNDLSWLHMSTRSSGHQTGFQAAWRWKKPAVLWATIGHEFMSQRLVAVIILWSKSGHGAEEEQNNFQSFEDETIPLLLRWMSDGNFCAGFF